jgi:hypothetical protein
MTTADSGALRADNGSNSDVPSDGGGAAAATNPVIDAINVNNSLGAGDVLAVIDGGAIGAIYGGGSVAISGGNLDVDALRVGGDDSILGLGDLVTDDQGSSGGRGERR